MRKIGFTSFTNGSRAYGAPCNAVMALLVYCSSVHQLSVSRLWQHHWTRFLFKDRTFWDLDIGHLEEPKFDLNGVIRVFSMWLFFPRICGDTSSANMRISPGCNPQKNRDAPDVYVDMFTI